MTQPNDMERLEIKAALSADADGTVEGIAWPFGTIDLAGDQIDSKAFEGSAAPLPMLFQHDEVVGVWDEIKTTAEGLLMKGRLLVDSVARAAEVRSMIINRAVQGLSIGFVTQKASPTKKGGRLISKLSLKECSIVAIPCNPDARITFAKDLNSMTKPNAAAEAATPEAKADDKVEKKAAPANDNAIDVKAIDAIQKRLDAVEAKANRPAATVETKAEDYEAKALNEWARTGQVDAELKTLVVGTAASGGYVTAPEYSTSIVKKIAELSPMRRLASVMSIGTSKVYIPTLASDAAGGWVTEVGERTEDEPIFGQIEIDVYEHAVIIPVSTQLLEDGMVDLSALLADRIGVKFAQAEATAFVSGNGSGKPEGIFASGNSFTSVTAKPDASDLLAKIVEAYYSLPQPYAQRATWAMTRKTMGKIRAAADVSANRSGIWSDGLADGTPARLLGAPVVEFPDMDDFAASKTVAILGDFSNYQIVDRVGLQIMRDDLTGADNGIVKFRARRRVGGKLLLTEAFRTLKTSAS